MTYFEVQNMNLKKPKLVGVTACGKGRSGVTTLASGIAAGLSRTSNGNVAARGHEKRAGSGPFILQWPAGCGLSDVLEPGNQAEAQVERNLFVASMQEETGRPNTRMEPAGFTQLMPKIKASNYDYNHF